MAHLTEKEQTVLNALRGIYHESEHRDPETGQVFGNVYLDNGIDTEDRVVIGVLGSLEKKGYYYSVDGYAWGAVLLLEKDIRGEY